VPIEKIVGPKPAGGWHVRPSGPPEIMTAQHRSPASVEVEAVRTREEARVKTWSAERNAGTPETAPALLANVWNPRLQVEWKLADGPTWFSCGESNTVLCVQPEGNGVKLSVRRVTRFDEATGVPATTELLLEKQLSLEKTDAKPHLLSVPDTKTMRLSLIAHPCPGKIAGALDVEVIQQTLDPDIPNTMRFMEPRLPPDRHWYLREELKAPWSTGAPVKGTLTGAANQEQFGPPTPQQPRTKPGVSGPKVGAEDGLDQEPAQVW
jgi:hypothetical protein